MSFLRITDAKTGETKYDSRGPRFSNADSKLRFPVYGYVHPDNITGPYDYDPFICMVNDEEFDAWITAKAKETTKLDLVKAYAEYEKLKGK